ncbi:Uncharacterised protein [Mycobacterium tuberculosis]|nr:Uncharacterised protein [Mycobacterium tuberculosis]
MLCMSSSRMRQDTPSTTRWWMASSKSQRPSATSMASARISGPRCRSRLRWASSHRASMPASSFALRTHSSSCSSGSATGS